jgi:hypothetical protein
MIPGFYFFGTNVSVGISSSLAGRVNVGESVSKANNNSCVTTKVVRLAETRLEGAGAKIT